MSAKSWVSVLIVLLGVAALITAPLAEVCTSGSDWTACETGGVVVLNVLGVILVALGGIDLLRSWRHKIGG